MATKLNSMRLLEKHGVPYEVVEYPDTIRDAEEIAERLGVPAHMVYKTLVVQSAAGGKPFLVMLAANRRLDLKAMAKAAGQKKVQMAAHKDAERETGLKVGGISALALMHKNWAVYIDRPATQLEHILISAGQRGMQLRVPVAALIQIVGARVAEVGSDSGGDEE